MSRSLKLSMMFCFMLLVGCSTPKVMNLNSQQVPKPFEKTAPALTQQDVKEAIVASLNERGWVVTKEADGLLEASILVKDRYYAKVKIGYNAENYSINYLDSRGLNYKAGTIHGAYNRWIAYLNKNIQKNLYAKIATLASVQK